MNRLHKHFLSCAERCIHIFTELLRLSINMPPPRAFGALFHRRSSSL